MTSFPHALRALGGLVHRRLAVPALRVKGRLGDREIDTTVDSEIARYYVEHYLRNDRREPEKDALIDEVERTFAGELPAREHLKELAQKVSVDFAALFLVRRIDQEPANRQLLARFRQELAATLAAAGPGAGPGAGMPGYPDYVILFVPGFLYQEDPESGADFRRPRDLVAHLGLAHQLVDIDQVGPVEHNADVVARQILQHVRDGKKIVLVGASSAGPAIALALSERLQPDEAGQVRAWVNIGGILRGSRRADAALRWPRRWLSRLICTLKGWRYHAIEGYTTAVSARRFDRLRLPPHLLIVNFVGVPLSGDVSKRAWSGYLSLCPEGPNDGLTPIVDAIAPAGQTIAEIGLDHYFLDPAIDAKTVGLARTVLGYLEPR
jgi:hypothetical protein